jgi:hypothetical protein
MFRISRGKCAADDRVLTGKAPTKTRPAPPSRLGHGAREFTVDLWRRRGQLLREVFVETLLKRGSSSIAPQDGHAGGFSSRSRIVMVAVNSFWHFGQKSS